LKIKKLIVRINTIGCRNCRPIYRKKLIDYYRSKSGGEAREKSLCKDCQRRLLVNPLRLLDCKVSGCQELRKDAPTLLNGLCAYCKAHFKSVLEYVEELKIPYVLDNYLVRGLDYYNRTVFEIFTEQPLVLDGAEAAKKVDGQTTTKFEAALGGGGRYDYLVELLGGRKETPGVGGALGLERLVEVMKAIGAVSPTAKGRAKVFLVHIGDLAKKKSLAILESLRSEGVEVTESLGKESLKAQLRLADKIDSPMALIFGQKEALEGSIILRDLQTGAQETVPMHRVVSEVKRRLK